MVSPHGISNTFPATADIETASDDYAGRFVGAGVVLTRSVPAYTIAVGIPARVARDRRGQKP